MRLLRHGTNGEGLNPARHRQASRGAWYPDPFELGDERWWDGNEWTGEVRTAAGSGGVRRQAEKPSIREPLGTSPRAPKPAVRSSTARRDNRFPVSIETVLDEQLSVVSSLRKPGMHCQLLAARGRAGSISVFGGRTARLACAHGAWFLKESHTTPRGLAIESADRRLAGSYLRRRLLPGGAIRLTDGTQVELRRSRPGRWKVRSVDGRTCVAEVRRSRKRSARGPELKVTVHSLPADVTNASLIILATCALLMLPAGID